MKCAPRCDRIVTLTVRQRSDDWWSWCSRPVYLSMSYYFDHDATALTSWASLFFWSSLMMRNSWSHRISSEVSPNSRILRNQIVPNGGSGSDAMVCSLELERCLGIFWNVLSLKKSKFSLEPHQFTICSHYCKARTIEAIPSDKLNQHSQIMKLGKWEYIDALFLKSQHQYLVPLNILLHSLINLNIN